MKKLLVLGIFVLVFMLSIGMSFGTSYESDIDPLVTSRWTQTSTMVSIEPYVYIVSMLNSTSENRQYKSADIYLLATHNGLVLLAYTLYIVDGTALHYEIDVVNDAFVRVESLESPGFVKRLEAGIEKRNKLMNE